MCIFRIVILFLLFMPQLNLAGIKISKDDTLVRMEGKVLDIVSNKPVKATIYYEKLPYGNDLGVVHTKDSGNYQFDLFPSANYKIHVKAPDYLAVIENILPTVCEESGYVHRNFYLKPIVVGEVFRLDHLIFDLGDYKIQESGYDELDQLADILNEHLEMAIQLEGHTDSRGNAKMNYKLSLQRVKMVKEYLVAKGVKQTRIKVKAFGGKIPLSKEQSEEARSINRRVEIRILKL